MFPACLLLLFLLVVPSLQALQINNAHDHGRRSIASPHVTTRNGQFFKDGKPFRYIGTNAYWIHQLNTDKDLEDTMNAIASYGIKVVRTWAFNDVTEIPKSGIYFQLWKNGTAVINTGENGLVRLDKVVKAAEKAGLHLLFSLTNNWAPSANSTTPAAGGQGNGTATEPTPGYLSNTYGGMDVYVREMLGHEATHDEFYTNPKIVAAFKQYLNVVVPRYANSSAVLGWELANDPRCNSTIPAGTLCNPHTITNWTTDIGSHVKTLDPNHLVASGDAGFYCVDCVKLHPLNPTPVQPQPLSGPSSVPRKRGSGPLTKDKVLRKVQSIADKIRSKRKATRPAKRGLSQMSSNGGTVIRGSWVPTRKPRQVQNVGPAFDGTYGVDTEDILNSPSVDFSSFQYFPDQNVYNQDQTNTGDDFASTVQQGVDWIQQHADTSATYGKPASITGFGIVSQPNSNTFTPVDATQTTPLTHTALDESQQVEAYTTWIDEAINQQITGITHYQWGQTGLTTVPDGVIQTNSGDTLPSSNGFSPNDGYATYSTEVKDVLQAGATKLQNIASDVTSGAT